MCPVGPHTGGPTSGTSREEAARSWEVGVQLFQAPGELSTALGQWTGKKDSGIEVRRVREELR